MSKSLRCFVNDLLVACFTVQVRTQPNQKQKENQFIRITCDVHETWIMRFMYYLGFSFFFSAKSTFYMFIHTLFTAQHARIYMCILRHWRLRLSFDRTDYAYLNGFNRYDFQQDEKKTLFQVLLLHPAGVTTQKSLSSRLCQSCDKLCVNTT